MRIATNNITVGRIVPTVDPRTNKKTTGTVKWVSPTGLTHMVSLADGFKTYNFAKEV